MSLASLAPGLLALLGGPASPLLAPPRGPPDPPSTSGAVYHVTPSTPKAHHGHGQAGGGGGGGVPGAAVGGAGHGAGGSDAAEGEGEYEGLGFSQV